MAEDEIIREHHQLSGHESEQTLGNSEGQEILECQSSWDYKELDMTEQLNSKCKFTECPIYRLKLRLHDVNVQCWS